MRSGGGGGGDRGSVTVVAAGLLFLAGALSLVAVDVMRTLQARAVAQTAADAAALAAAQEIALPSGLQPAAVASDYASRNGGTLLSCSCEPFSAEADVTVQVPVVLIFLSPGRTVTAAARAVIAAGTMARHGRTHAVQAIQAASVDGRRRLHACKARSAAELPQRTAVATGDL